MIDQKAFFEKHKDFPKFSLEKMLELSKTEFPRKLEALEMHIKNSNFGEIMYFADFIDDSFAFIFCDYDLRDTLQNIYKAAKRKDSHTINSLYPILKTLSASFITELENIIID